MIHQGIISWFPIWALTELTFGPWAEVTDSGLAHLKGLTQLQKLRFHCRPRPGSGPRHMKFSPDGRFAFIINELNLAVDACSWDPEGGILKHLFSAQSLTDEEQARELENGASEIRVHPSGKFVYSANRGNDSIAVFKVDEDTGALQRVQLMPTRSAWPRNFNLDPSGRWLICGGQDSSNAGVFSVDNETGMLTYMPHSNINLPSPICVTFVE